MQFTDNKQKKKSVKNHEHLGPEVTQHIRKNDLKVFIKTSLLTITPKEEKWISLNAKKELVIKYGIKNVEHKSEYVAIQK